MIIDRLENLSSYAGLGDAFAKAAEWLEKTETGALPDGRVEVDGENVFATVSENRLKEGPPSYEAHRRYADIQVILEGEERFFYGTKAKILPAGPGTDVFPCEVEEAVEYVLKPGQFTVFLPGEVHAPGNAAGTALCRKIVVKVLA